MCHPCTIMWEADVPPAVGHIAAAPSLAFLDQGLLGHLIWDEVCIYPGLSNLFFCTGFSGRALYGHWDAVLLIMFYSHFHSLSVLWAFLGGLYVAIGMLFYWIMPYSHSHSLSVLWAFLGGLYLAIGMLFYWIMP